MGEQRIIVGFRQRDGFQFQSSKLKKQKETWKQQKGKSSGSWETLIKIKFWSGTIVLTDNGRQTEIKGTRN